MKTAMRNSKIEKSTSEKNPTDKFELTVLGSSAAVPIVGRGLTSHLLSIGTTKLLIDCGDATQAQLQKYGNEASKISHILISHLHGDHFFGIMALLSSYQLQGREKPLYLIAPPDLQAIIEAYKKYANFHTDYEIVFIATQTNEIALVWENKFFTIQTFPTLHSIPCTGFIFTEKEKLRNISKEKLPENLPYELIKQLKEGKNIYFEDRLLTVEEYTTAPCPPRKYVYAADTAYNEAAIPCMTNADLLYHETTFLQQDAPKADATKHSTTTQAAEIALKANVKQLLIGHYSIRYKNTSLFLKETQQLFPNTTLGYDGLKIVLLALFYFMVSFALINVTYLVA
jgi:ribonuclease Z